METWVRSLGQEDPLEKKMVTHSNILAWKPMDRGVWQATVQESPETALSDPQTPVFTFLLLFCGRGGVVSTGDRRAALGPEPGW